MPTPSFSRRGFLHAGTALASTSLLTTQPRQLQAAAPATNAPFRFIHLTDVHVQPERGAADGWMQCVQRINQLDPLPDFVITGGDLIMDALAADPDRIDLEWSLFDAALKELAVPAYHTIGNHDIGGWSPKSKLSTKDTRYGKHLFAERYSQGKTWYSFDHKGWHFVILDSVEKAPAEDPGSGYVGIINDEQLEWLAADMQRTGRHVPTVVVTHIPFFSTMLQTMEGSQAPLSKGGLVTNAHVVRKMLEPYNVQLVLSGHGHIRERIDVRSVTYIQSGAVSGGWWRGPLFREQEAFGLIECHPDHFDYQFHDYGWEIRPA